MPSPRSQDPRRIIARLEHRLERERRGRLAAEAAAERGLRDLDQGRTMHHLVEAIAMATNQNDCLQETLSYALEQICAFMGWATGHVYWVADDGERLISADLWHGMDGSRDLFRFATFDHQPASRTGVARAGFGVRPNRFGCPT